MCDDLFEVEDFRFELESEKQETSPFRNFSDMDPSMFCSPIFFYFNPGTYELLVKDLLGIFMVTVESLEDVAQVTPVNLNAWRHMKSRPMLKNEECNLYLKNCLI